MGVFIIGKCACGCGRDLPNLRAVKGYLMKYINGHSKPKVKYHCNKCKDQNLMIECKCGCEEIITKRDKFYVIREYDFGHAIRTRGQRGENNSNWKGGKHYNPESGYHYTRRVDHPNNNNGYIANHRLVMEHYLKILFDEDIYIPSHTEVHHIDKNKENNSLMNLEMLSKSDHVVKHNVVDTSGWFCSNPDCLNPNGYPHRRWMNDGKGGHLCNRCYAKKNRYRYSKKNRKVKK